MKRPPLEWDPAGKAHAALMARLPRCPSCLRRVPLPTSDGRCLICYREGSRKGALPVPPWPVERAPEVDAEGGLLTPSG